MPGDPKEYEFTFRSVENIEVHQMMLKWLPKARGYSCDGLSLSYFKDLLLIITPFFTNHFNQSIETSKYPNIWKKSVIVPLSKISTPKSTADTRPVANLAHFAKVFDSLMTQQLTDHLETNNILSKFQFGFRKSFSTQTALIKITEDVRRGVDAKLVTVLLLFDFKRAFDYLNHQLLLRELKNLNFSNSAIKWLHSYLTGCSQAVMDLDGIVSDYLQNTSGVPQGSTPGPIIFLIFINSVLSVLKHTKNSCMLFADDLQIYIQSRRADVNSAITRLNVDAEAIVRWCDSHGLLLNVAKTKAILLGSTQNLMRIDRNELNPIIVNGTVIPFVNSAKNLGVVLSDDLTWNSHISQIYSRVNFILYRLRYKGYNLSSQLKAKLVNALVIPHFDYACVVFHGLSKYCAKRLQVLINIAI